MVPEAGREQVCNSIKSIPVTLQKNIPETPQKASQKLHKSIPVRGLSAFLGGDDDPSLPAS